MLLAPDTSTRQINQYLESHAANGLHSELRQIDNEAGASTATQSVNLQGVRFAQAGCKVVSRQHLAYTLENIWQAFFADIPRVNLVEIAYGQPWKRRLGLIRLSLDTTRTFIGVNALLQQPEVPEYVLFTTIAHELVHYAHGFGSPLPRLFEHPHANEVVERELERRRLGEMVQKCDEWIDNMWFAFYDMQQKTRSTLKATRPTDCALAVMPALRQDAR